MKCGKIVIFFYKGKNTWFWIGSKRCSSKKVENCFPTEYTWANPPRGTCAVPMPPRLPEEPWSRKKPKKDRWLRLISFCYSRKSLLCLLGNYSGISNHACCFPLLNTARTSCAYRCFLVDTIFSHLRQGSSPILYTFSFLESFKTCENSFRNPAISYKHPVLSPEIQSGY